METVIDRLKSELAEMEQEKKILILRQHEVKMQLDLTDQIIDGKKRLIEAHEMSMKGNLVEAVKHTEIKGPESINVVHA